MKKMKKMKKTSLLLLAVFSLTFGFVGCEKDPSEITQVNNPITKINAKVENGAVLNGVVKTVRLISDEGFVSTILGEAKYENGGFNMKLQPVANSELITIADDMPDEVVISDLNAKFIVANRLMAYSSTNNESPIGVFEYTKNSIEDFISVKDTYSFDCIVYIYVDRDVNFKGIWEEDDITTLIDLKLKKGWNMVRMLISAEVNGDENYMKIGITNISNVIGYKWIYIPSDYEFSVKQKGLNKLFR